MLCTRTSLVAQTVKCLSTMWETQVQAPGWEDTLEKEMAITPVLLPGKSHGQRSLVGYSLSGTNATTLWYYTMYSSTNTTTLWYYTMYSSTNATTLWYYTMYSSTNTTILWYYTMYSSTTDAKYKIDNE